MGKLHNQGCQKRVSLYEKSLIQKNPQDPNILDKKIHNCMCYYRITKHWSYNAITQHVCALTNNLSQNNADTMSDGLK